MAPLGSATESTGMFRTSIFSPRSFLLFEASPGPQDEVMRVEENLFDAKYLTHNQSSTTVPTCNVCLLLKNLVFMGFPFTLP